MNTTIFNTKIGELENKTLDVSGLVEKMDYNTKITYIEVKYFTTFHYNVFTSDLLEMNTA